MLTGHNEAVLTNVSSINIIKVLRQERELHLHYKQTIINYENINRRAIRKAGREYKQTTETQTKQQGYW